MSDFGDGSGGVWNLGVGDFEGLVISLIITVITLVVCLVCTLVICIVRCSVRDCADEGRGQLFSGGSTLHRSPNGHARQGDLEYQMEQQEEEGEEGTREWDLSEAPPPSYGHVKEYKSVDIERAEVVRLKRSTYRLSSHMEPEEVSLPPDYASNRGEDDTSERAISAALEDGQLPPTYSTAQMELMARRSATELDIPTELAETSVPVGDDDHESSHSETSVRETPNL